MLESLISPETLGALLTIIGIDIVLSGDNAVVIALACRNLPPKQQRLGIVAGTGAAVGLRVVFTIFIAYLMTVPYLKAIGGALLFWVGYKLVAGDNDEENIDPAGNLWQAIRIIVVADAVMSLDNMIAVAAAAKGSVPLLIAGLLISIPLVVSGAALLLKMIERYPVIVPAGAALIGYIGGEVVATDPIIEPWLEANAAWLHQFAPLIGAIAVIAVSRVIAPPKKTDAAEVAKEAAAGAGLFAARAVLIRIAALLAGGVAYGLGERGGPDVDSALLKVLEALLPVFAVMIAIVAGEALAALLRRLRRRTA
jgi:YjbE family integral membrane protein